MDYDPNKDSFELKNTDIPRQIHKLYINKTLHVIPFGAIKGYLPGSIQSMDISDDTQCIYTYENPQKQNIYDYDLDLSYIKRDNSNLGLVSPNKTDIYYCETNEDDIPSCSILSCNKYNSTDLQRDAMSTLIKQNNKESAKKVLHDTRKTNHNASIQADTSYTDHVNKFKNIYTDHVDK
jgi:hypothetical protein